VSPEEWREAIRPWLRESHGTAFDAALEWLWPRCRTEEERLLAPALLLLLSPLNALVAPCRPVAGSCVNLQVTLSRNSAAGPQRIRLSVRGWAQQASARAAGQHMDETPRKTDRPVAELWLDDATVTESPLSGAALVLKALLGM
jgi:hypothetical protein